MPISSRLGARRVPAAPVAPVTAEAFLSERSSGARADAAEALARDPRRAARLLPELLRRERHVLVLACLCEAAASARGSATERELRTSLGRLASGHRSPIVRAFACGALLARGGVTTRWLRQRLALERGPYARVPLLAALSAEGDAAAMAELERLARSKRPAVRARAKQALAR